MATDLPESWMWQRAWSLLEEVDRLQKQFFQLGRPGQRQPSWEPPIDVFETDADVWIVVALPGVDEESIELGFDGKTLVVAGERTLPGPCRQATVCRLEIPHGRFERTVALPSPCTSIYRRFQDGCLLLRLRKRGL
jgi:HSP20 family molecular chaperone IbpA